MFPDMILPDRDESWIRMTLKWRGSIIPRIKAELAAAALLATAVTVAYKVAELHGIGLKDLSLTHLPFSLVGLALAIFLAFRINASYDRHWEGRKLWGQLVNVSRSLTRQIQTLITAGPDESHDEELGELASLHRDAIYRLIAFSHALRHHLREEPFDDLAAFLPREEGAALAGERNIPVAILARLGDRFHGAWKRGWVNDHHHCVLESSLGELTGILGGCERIKNSPLPFAYSLLIHRITSFYCFCLPFGIVDAVGYMTPLVVLLVSYAFFGLGAIGEEIEDPFGTDPNDLPLAALSRTIEINLRQRLGETQLPAPVEPAGGILL